MLTLLRGLVLALALAMPAAAHEVPEDGFYKLALQISDNDPQKMNTLLNVAANVSRHYSAIGKSVEIQIVAFNAGLHMLRQDTSPVADRLRTFSQGMPNVEFAACGNTIEAMARKEGKEPPIMDFATRVPAGVVTLMELNLEGWTIVRP